MSDFILTPPIKTMEDAFSVKGKNVVITGGNRGIGRGITQAFAESGANIVIPLPQRGQRQKGLRGNCSVWRTLCVLSLRDFQP